MANKDEKQTTVTTVDPKDEVIANLQAQLAASEKKSAESEAALADAIGKLKAEKSAQASESRDHKPHVIKLYKGQNVKDDVQTFVNGRQRILMRGKEIEVPHEVFVVLRNQERMRNRIDAYNEKHEMK